LSAHTHIPAHLRAAAAFEAESLLKETAGVTTVVIATTDGFEIAWAAASEVDPARIAALASSIAAIGDVVSSEASLGPAKTVIVESEGGFALAQRVARSDLPLVIKVLAGPDAVLAQAKYRASAAAGVLAIA
jgi:predicted regulator of Ras-like GTPase activity (Roadblock/LC7/MglB family)